MQSLENNRRIQAQNNAPQDFPAFVRNGYDIKIMADGYDRDDKGLIYKASVPQTLIKQFFSTAADDTAEC